MDIMKRETVIDYTSWDLNTKCVKVKNRQKLEAKLKRKARRKNKEKLRKILDNIDSIWYNKENEREVDKIKTKVIIIKDSRLKQYADKKIKWITDEPEVLEFARRLTVEGVIDKIEVKDFE